MPVLEMSHQREPLPLHSITSSPEAGNVVSAQGTVQSYRVILNLLRCLEWLHAALPLTQEGLLGVNLDWGRLLIWRWGRAWVGLGL